MRERFLDRKKEKTLCVREAGGLRLRKSAYRSGGWNATHRHSNARFVFVLNGTFAEKYEGKKRLCKPFTGIFRPPEERHSESYEDGVVCISVDVPPCWHQRLAEHSVNLNDSYSFRSQNLRHLINKISFEMSFTDDVSALAIEALVSEIAVEMYRTSNRRDRHQTPAWLTTAVEYIEEYFDTSLSLPEIASISGVHPVHLSRVFKTHMNYTTTEYIRQVRVEAARNLLLESKLTLAQIAAETGFSDQSHFTKTFKRYMHMTPAQYRRSSKSG